MHIEPFFDARTYTLTYVVADLGSRDAVIIDPVLDYSPVGSKVFTESADAVVAWIEAKGLTVHAILETHAHADHLSGARYLKGIFPAAQIAIGARITEVQGIFKAVFDLPPDFPIDGRQFDRLLEDGELIEAGTLSIKALSTPGHTPACMTFEVEDALFTGDLLFMPDQGTGRCDFPGGSARALYDSVNGRIYDHPPETRIFVGHDYQPGGRELAWMSTVAEQRELNVQLPAGLSGGDFVKRREARDATLDAPRLLYQSVQVNIDAGRFPRAAATGGRYLKIPVNVFHPDGDGALQLETI